MAVSTLDIQSIPNGNAPQAYTVPGSQSFDLVGVRAIFDGTAAGSAFLPCVQIKSAAGHVMQQVTGSSVLAGGSADVTFGSFLEQPAVSGGSYTPPIAFEDVESNTLTLVSGGTSPLQWTYFFGDALADLTNPAQPKIITAGIYAFTGQVISLENVNAGRLVSLLLEANLLTATVFAATYTAPTGGAPANLGFALTQYMPANTVFQMHMTNNDTISHDFVINFGTIQRVT